MASSTEMTGATNSGKAAAEGQEEGYIASAPPPPPPPHPASFTVVEYVLRLLLFGTTLSALVVLAVGKQTKLIPTGLLPPLPAFVPREAKFQNSPALIYLLVALSVTCFYSIITFLLAISSRVRTTKTLFHLILLDVVMAGVMASAMGSAASVAYIGLKGNSHVNWGKICNVYSKFCRYIGGSIAVSLAASNILIILVVLSAYSLYRRTPST